MDSVQISAVYSGTGQDDVIIAGRTASSSENSTREVSSEAKLIRHKYQNCKPLHGRRKSVHDLQEDLDNVLRDVTNLVENCLASPYVPRMRRASK
jgi:hypothetical protein